MSGQSNLANSFLNIFNMLKQAETGVQYELKSQRSPVGLWIWLLLSKSCKTGQPSLDRWPEASGSKCKCCLEPDSEILQHALRGRSQRPNRCCELALYYTIYALHLLTFAVPVLGPQDIAERSHKQLGK